MTVSLRVMSAKKGYEYLLRSVVTGDGNRSLSTPLTRYYLDEGTPPGNWLGTGVAEFGEGELRPGDAVTAGQLEDLLGRGHDPVTHRPLGEEFRQYPRLSERVDARVVALPAGMPADARATAIEKITGEESTRQTPTAVAGYDLTFSVTKSVSVLWALSDAQTQARIVKVHHAAVADVIALLEREVASTRVGYSSRAEVPVAGIAATAYDHYDSRANDPQLHTHVVVSN